jgi:hypothetical protein
MAGDADMNTANTGRWSSAAREELLAAARDLADAVLAHAAAVAAATDEEALDDTVPAGDALADAGDAYLTACAVYAGEDLADSLDSDLVPEPVEPGDDAPATFSVLQRRDFSLVNLPALLFTAATDPLIADEIEDQPDRRGQVGRALLALLEQNGLDGLLTNPGLHVEGACTVVQEQPQPLGTNHRDWPAHLFTMTTGTPLCRLDELPGLDPE